MVVLLMLNLVLTGAHHGRVWDQFRCMKLLLRDRLTQLGTTESLVETTLQLTNRLLFPQVI